MPQSAIPQSSKLQDIVTALFVIPKVLDSPIAQEVVPFVAVPVLKEALSLEIVLAHGALNRVNGCWDKAIRRPEFSKCQVERLFVTVNVAIIEIAILIKPGAETESLPA